MHASSLPKFSEILHCNISQQVNTILNRLRKVVNPLKEKYIKGNIIPNLCAFRGSQSRTSYQKSLAVLFSRSGFYCLPENESHAFQLLPYLGKQSNLYSLTENTHIGKRDHRVLKVVVDCNWWHCRLSFSWRIHHVGDGLVFLIPFKQTVYNTYLADLKGKYNFTEIIKYGKGEVTKLIHIFENCREMH